MYHLGDGARPCPFPITGKGQGRFTEPNGDQFSGRNLGMIPYRLKYVTGGDYTGVKCARPDSTRGICTGGGKIQGSVQGDLSSGKSLQREVLGGKCLRGKSPDTNFELKCQRN